MGHLLLCKKRKGYFCIAKADFENGREVTVIKDDLDYKFIHAVKRARAFCKKAIFPVLLTD